MVETIQEKDSSLAEMLRTRARSASDTRLAADVGVGLLALIVSLLWPYPFRHMVLEAAVCFMAFGVWGIIDRELHERTEASAASTRRFRAVQWVAVAAGSIAAVALAITVLGVIIGRVIS